MAGLPGIKVQGVMDILRPGPWGHYGIAQELVAIDSLCYSLARQTPEAASLSLYATRQWSH